MRIYLTTLLIISLACAGTVTPSSESAQDSEPPAANPQPSEPQRPEPQRPEPQRPIQPPEEVESQLPRVQGVASTIVETGDMPWHYWSVPIGLAEASSTLAPQGSRSYEISNLSDFDNQTAWVEGTSGQGIGESLTFTFHDFGEGVFGQVYAFFGVCQIINGYTKTPTTWSENSRVKSMTVYFNSSAFAEIELIDTTTMQTFDLTPFFNVPQYRQPNPTGFSPKAGDTLRFEITEVYPGTKYADTAITEFVGQAGGN